MPDVLVYRVDFTPPAANTDIISQELKLIIEGEEVSTQTFEVTKASAEVRVPEGKTARVEVVHIDNAGNRSEPAIREFTAVDTLPPPKPGDMTVELTNEEYTSS